VIVMSRGTHVFLSYVRDDSAVIDRLERELHAAGVEVWRDLSSLAPGDQWRHGIDRAIRDGRFFLACFSPRAAARPDSGMHDELRVAAALLHGQPELRKWLIPLRLEPCEIPALPIGQGQTLRDIQRLDLFPDWDAAIHRLLQSFWQGAPAAAETAEPDTSSQIETVQTIEEIRGGQVDWTGVENKTGLPMRAKTIQRAGTITDARVTMVGVKLTGSTPESSS
jgi:hypothetical protein